MANTFSNLLDRLHLTSKEEGVQASEPTEEELKDLRDIYVKAGQDHVFTFYDDLSTSEKAGLFERLKSFDPQYINEITEKALHPPQSSDESQETRLEPLPEAATASILDSKEEDVQSWYTSGL
ncbi:MAG: hypothetical protein Q9198_010409, partial [Flavoplaca austrocitrina]